MYEPVPEKEATAISVLPGASLQFVLDKTQDAFK